MYETSIDVKMPDDDNIVGEAETFNSFVIGFDPNSLANKGFGLYAESGVGIYKYYDIFGNVTSSRQSVFFVKKQLVFYILVNLYSTGFWSFWISTILLLLGFLLLYRNLFIQSPQVNVADVSNPRYLTFLGFSGGFIDASGGGGWGPVVTPTLLATTQTEPRKVIGTVSAAEFIVAVCASLGFLLNINQLDIDWSAVGGLALGGVLMAPVAAKLVSWLPRKQLGIFVAVAIILINGFRLLSA
jgi:hypothetical protein